MQGKSFYLLRSAAKAVASLLTQGSVRIPAPGHATVGRPPRARGIYDSQALSRKNIGLTPACAGNIISLDTSCNHARMTPAFAGEYPVTLKVRRSNKGRPPRSRGICSTLVLPLCIPGKTPAFAGNIIRGYLYSLCIKG